MFSFNPMLKQIHVMDKSTFPFGKRRTLILKDFPIPNFPYIPAGHNQDFHEERFSKISLGRSHNALNIITRRPINLKIRPYPLAEIAIKEKVGSIFICSGNTKHTMFVFSHLPMSPNNKISGVQAVRQQQSGKIFSSHNTSRLPNPRENWRG
jgi:hypothetical protein